MKKRALSILPALVLCLALLPSAALAVSVGTIPGSWTAPTGVLITDETEGDGEFVLRVSYSVGADHSTFADDIENQNNYSKYGLTDAIYSDATTQIDWRIDGGAWHYSAQWDSGNETRTGADAWLYYREFAPYGSERTGSNQILRLPSSEDYSSNYEGWRDAMTAQGVTDLTVSGGGFMRLDLTKHKVDVRVRILTRLWGADVDAAYGAENSEHFILSPWSELASIGRGTGGAEKPASIPRPAVSNFAVKKAVNDGTVDDGYPIFTFSLAVPAEITEIDAAATALWATLGIEGQVNVDNGGWQDIRIGSGSWAAVTDGQYTGYMPGLSGAGVTSVLGGSVQFRTRYHWFGGDSGELYSDWSAPLTFSSDGWKSSDWATETLRRAEELGLIPDELRTADLTKNITRREFAAVCVKAYENLSGVLAIPAVINPFTDCADLEVLKAYNVGITDGVTETAFEPDTLLNREQAATMLTRVFKRVSMPGWTLATDGDFPLAFTMPAPFADDARISDWAKPSVYFMAANGIIDGMDGHLFAPRAVTPAEQAAQYASATREQAIVIAVRMAENLK